LAKKKEAMNYISKSRTYLMYLWGRTDGKVEGTWSIQSLYPDIGMWTSLFQDPY
jgi:hypothetical protein